MLGNVIMTEDFKKAVEIADQLETEKIKTYEKFKNKIKQCTIHSVTCSLCTEKDKMYSFKVRDYITEIVGRKNEEGGFFYIQRGDGTVHKYDADRVTQANELNYR